MVRDPRLMAAHYNRERGTVLAMALTKGGLLQPQGMTTVERDLLALAGADHGRLIWNETTNTLQQWMGSSWVDVFVKTDTLPFAQVTGQVPGARVDGPIDGVKLIGGSVATAALADGSVTTVKLADGSVTNAKVATGLDAGKLTGIADGGVY